MPRNFYLWQFVIRLQIRSSNNVKIFCLFLDPLPPHVRKCPIFDNHIPKMMSDASPSPKIRASFMDDPIMEIWKWAVDVDAVWTDRTEGWNSYVDLGILLEPHFANFLSYSTNLIKGDRIFNCSRRNISGRGGRRREGCSSISICFSFFSAGLVHTCYLWCVLCPFRTQHWQLGLKTF